jgi:hypothetical protein
VGAVDPGAHTGEVAVAEAAEVAGRGRGLLARRQDVQRDVRREGGQIGGEAVPPGDLERDRRDLPRPGRRAQGAVDAPDVQHVDRLRPEGHGPADGDAVDEPAVEVVLAVQFDRRQQAGDGGGGEHRRDQRPIAEPVFRGPFDAGRDALEGDVELGEGVHREVIGEQVAQRLPRVQVRPGPHQGADPGQHRTGEDPLRGEFLPHRAQPVDRRRHGVGRDERAVDRADRRAHDQVGTDAVLEQGRQHPDLGGAEHSPAPEDERRAAPPGRHQRRRHGRIVPATQGPGRSTRRSVIP